MSDESRWHISGYRTEDGSEASIVVRADAERGARAVARRRDIEPRVVRALDVGPATRKIGPATSTPKRRRAA